MKLENVDLSKLQLTDLPKFDKCPCELCDDGCFDRSGGQHHPECRRKQIPQTKVRTTRCPLSHYQATFKAATAVSGGPADHRRQPCPPPPDNEIPISFKHVPMAGVSSQREHYPPPPPDSLKRTSPVSSVKQTDSVLSRRSAPMETQSHYQVEYTEKPVMPISLRQLEIPSKGTKLKITEPTAQVSSQTTNRTHFVPWQPTLSPPYAEMPAVVGQVLFPGPTRQFSTSTGSTHVPFPQVLPTKPVARAENTGTLRNTGSMDLQTSYRDNYVPLKPISPKSPRKANLNEEQVFARRPMNAISQTSLDFRPYPNHRPPSPAEMEPFASQITIGNSLAPSLTKSQYRSDYPGIDTTKHHRPPPAACKPQDKPYVVPNEKMDTLTVTQRDYPPLEVEALPRLRLVPIKSTITINDKTAPMESMTTSRTHYQSYQPVKSRQYYGESIPNIYVPPKAKFEGSTTTGDTYRGSPGSRPRPYIPETKRISQTGEYDHNTNYRLDYHSHGLTLCAAKAYAIAQKKQQAIRPPIAAQ